MAKEIPRDRLPRLCPVQPQKLSHCTLLPAASLVVLLPIPSPSPKAKAAQQQPSSSSRPGRAALPGGAASLRPNRSVPKAADTRSWLRGRAARRAQSPRLPLHTGTKPRDGRKPPAAPRHPAKTQKCPSPPAKPALCEGEPGARGMHGFGWGWCRCGVPPTLPAAAWASHLHPIPSPGAEGAGRVWGGGFSPTWVLSPGSRAHAGLGSALTQREQQAEASEVPGGLREPGFRAHFWKELRCVARAGGWWLGCLPGA